MKTVKVVAAIIIHENKIFATQRDMVSSRTVGNSRAERSNRGRRRRRPLVREIKEELDIEIEVKDFLETVEYDYPDFHLSMDCFFCSIRSGEMVLKEHEGGEMADSGDTGQCGLAAGG